MKNIDYKILVIVLATCLIIGVVVDYFSDFNWLTSSLALLAAILVNGLIIGIEDREPGGWGYDEKETLEIKKQHRKAVVIHICFIILVVSAAILSTQI